MGVKTQGRMRQGWIILRLSLGGVSAPSTVGGRCLGSVCGPGPLLRSISAWSLATLTVVLSGLLTRPILCSGPRSESWI